MNVCLILLCDCGCVCVCVQASEGEPQPMTEVDLFISTQRIKVLNADSQVLIHTVLNSQQITHYVRTLI